jgi:ATP-binding cassette, subfamily B (MDR/TAP), member 9
MKHRYMGGYMSGNILISNGLAAATLWYGGHLILEDRISGDTLIPFVLYQVNLIFGLSSNLT